MTNPGRNLANHSHVTMEFHLRFVHPPTGISVVVAQPSPTFEHALHICRYPVEQPQPWNDVVHLSRPLADPHTPGALGAEVLLLPEHLVIDTWLMIPPDLERGLSAFWTTLPDVPLTVPLLVHRQRQFDQGLGVQIVVTPRQTGSLFNEEDHQTVAWAVLARANLAETVEALAWLSCLVEIRRGDPSVAEMCSIVVAAPQPHGGRLLAAARGGEVVFDPKALRWMIAELVAADPAELRARASWRPTGQSGADLLGAAWFAGLWGQRRPTAPEVMLAIWMLQEAFHGSDADFSDPDGILGGVTALGYATTADGDWLPKLDRWSSIWGIPDNHPAVSTASHPPSSLRSLFTAELGLNPSEWLAGTWFLCFRWWLQLMQPRPAVLRMVPAELFTARVADRQIDLAPRFTTAFEQHLVSNMANLGAQVRQSSGSYTGLGSVPQTDVMAVRNHPVLRLPNGSYIPMSLELVADRASSLWRFVLPQRLHGVRSCIAAMGYPFEAYITDVLAARLGGHHLLLTEADITSVLGQATRCDQVVIHGTDWLFIENSIITLNRRIADGGIAAIDDICDSYHAEADQATNTANEANRLAAAFGLPMPTTKAILVVTDNAVVHTPAFTQRLWLRRPARNPRFLCGIRELETLAELASIGWSMPGAVSQWQHQPVEGPLQSTIHKMATIASWSRTVPTSAEQWLSRVPQEGHSPAA
jgi:hypothetical protein